MIQMTLGHLRRLLIEAGGKPNPKRAVDEFLAVVRNAIVRYIEHDYRYESHASADELAESNAEQFVSDYWDECSEWAKIAFSGEQPPAALKNFNGTWPDHDPLERLLAVARYEFFNAIVQYEQTGMNALDPNVMFMRKKHKGWTPPDPDDHHTDWDDEADRKDFNNRVSQEFDKVWRDIKKGDVIQFSPVKSVMGATVSVMNGIPDMVTGTVKGVLRGKVVFEEPVVAPSYYHNEFQEHEEFNFSEKWRDVVDVGSWARGNQELYRHVKRLSAVIERMLNDPDFEAAIQDKVETFHAVEIIERASERAMVDISGFTKSDLICYVLSVRGPMRKDDVLKVVAVLEDKPYKQGSNVTYFSQAGMVGDTIENVGIAPGTRNAALFDVNDHGRTIGERVRSRLGDEPAKGTA